PARRAGFHRRNGGWSVRSRSPSRGRGTVESLGARGARRSEDVVRQAPATRTGEAGGERGEEHDHRRRQWAGVGEADGQRVAEGATTAATERRRRRREATGAGGGARTERARGRRGAAERRRGERLRGCGAHVRGRQ